MTAVCIIPARAGSVRIKGKNTREFLGKPVLQYSIEAARASGLFDRIFVNSEDDGIGSLAAKLGATFYRRPVGLASDLSTMAEVVCEQLESMRAKGGEWEAMCMLYACAPLVTPKMLIDGLGKLEAGYDVVFPIVPGPHVENSLFIKAGRLMNRYPEHEGENSQLWTDAYWSAGAFYWARTAALLESGSFDLGRRWGLVMHPAEMQDIDVPEDWTLAEAKYKARMAGRE